MEGIGKRKRNSSHAHTYLYTLTCMHTHSHIHAHSHTCTHTHTHALSYTQVLSHPWITSRDSLPDVKLSIKNNKLKVRTWFVVPMTTLCCMGTRCLVVGIGALIGVGTCVDMMRSICRYRYMCGHDEEYM